ncbi:Nif11-like leader peptide family natural product precursor [Coraliomargarita parva]|uniref:Nif11-like leader peptide family natural product precursor n=1 Tax=Coraliomargarita parva TaxID=3014050 RepID=UPI0022B51943|nr:Nif11-like leader peptide family natural product precursor [Coraliomargarita parva]
MSKENVEKLMMAGGADKKLRIKYDLLETKEDFIAMAKEDGYDFTLDELNEVLKEERMTFDSYGNPRTREVWIR